MAIFIPNSGVNPFGKMAIFIQKSRLNLFGKTSIFPPLELLVFIAQKGVFFVLGYHKGHFPGLYCLKKKLEKRPFLNQNHGLTPLEKCQFFVFVNFTFLQPRKAFFSFQDIIKDIFLGYIAKKKKLEKWLFLDQNHGLTPLEKCQFFEFLNFMF